MYLFLGIFPSCRPKAIRKNHEIAFFDPKDKRKEEKTLSSPFIFSLSLSLAAERPRARERCTLPLCGGGGGGGGLCNNAFSREERRRVIKLFQSKERFIRKVKVKVPLPPPLV